MGNDRWAYMADPRHNPPTNHCSTCLSPSRTFFIGGKRVGENTQHRYQCEHGHQWVQVTTPPT